MPSIKKYRVLLKAEKVPRTSQGRNSTRHFLSRPVIVTIDGPAGVGKSTVAKTLAQKLGLMYLDTGATYRSLAYLARRQKLHEMDDADRIAELASQLPIDLRVRKDGSLQVLLSGKDVSRAIRTEEVSESAAVISQHPPVRRALVKRQRELADTHGVVVEGRDTGSVVFPKASHKFFLDADADVRAHRRQREMAHVYGSNTPLALIRQQLHFRDELDRKRRVGPLIKPRGAIAIDTTHRTIGQVVRLMLLHIRRTGRDTGR